MKKNPFKDLVLDAEEQEIEDAIERGEFVSMPAAEFEIHKKKLQQAASKQLQEMRKDKTISLRIPSEILALTKAKAQKLGIPYQTLLGSWIHQQATNEEVKL